MRAPAPTRSLLETPLPRLSLRRGLAAACLLAALAAALPAAAFIGNFRGPKVDGELALPGLTQPVRVLRDEHGIPYIFAANTPDLIRAQGFVTAQDRLFQIEGYRAIATGRLAEAVGEGGLANDRQIRLIGLRRNAERITFIGDQRAGGIVEDRDRGHVVEVDPLGLGQARSGAARQVEHVRDRGQREVDVGRGETARIRRG